MGEITQDEIISRFALQHLCERVAAHCGLNCVLHIGDVDLVTCSRVPVYRDVQVRLTEDAKNTEVLNARNLTHNRDDLIRLALKGLQIIAIDLGGEFAFHSADGLFHVVFNGLRKSPKDAGNLVEFALHGCDQLIFVFMEYRPPLLFRFQVDKILGIEKSRGIGAVIGTADLTRTFRNFGEGAQNDACLVGNSDSFVGTGAGSEGPANPECAFIEMG